ncbi:MAG: hypothetical protein C5B55_12535 [Blastocatellia bacterium]|nr:MAG: hypothetical protein C5B55_12535 [Blastocatellia bacterium]
MDRRIVAIREKIEREASLSLSIAALGMSVGLSASRLRHLFKHETGETLSQYIKEERLKRGEFLLRTTYLSVKEIATQVGMGSGPYFARQFKTRFGTSPTTYRLRFGPSAKGD